jgi:hypothetical protein
VAELEAALAISQAKFEQLAAFGTPAHPAGSGILSVFREMDPDGSLAPKRLVTDKFTMNDYSAIYEKHLIRHRLSGKPYKMLEMGLGCVGNEWGGRSFEFFKNFTPAVDYWGLDIEPCRPQIAKHLIDEFKSRVYQGSMVDKRLMHSIVEKHGPFDIIIDDGSHHSVHQLGALNLLFPHALKSGGVYCVEDLHHQWDKGPHPKSMWDRRETFIQRLFETIQQLQISVWFSDSRDVIYPPMKGFLRVFPQHKFRFFKYATMIRSVEFDRGIVCLTKMDTLSGTDWLWDDRSANPCENQLYCDIPAARLRKS